MRSLSEPGKEGDVAGQSVKGLTLNVQGFPLVPKYIFGNKRWWSRVVEERSAK